MRQQLSEDDRLIAEHMRRAMREVQDALSIAKRSRHGRAYDVVRELSRIAAALGSVGTVAPKVTDDPDLMPEDERTRRWRETRQRKRE